MAGSALVKAALTDVYAHHRGLGLHASKVCPMLVHMRHFVYHVCARVWMGCSSAAVSLLLGAWELELRKD